MASGSEPTAEAARTSPGVGPRRSGPSLVMARARMDRAVGQRLVQGALGIHEEARHVQGVVQTCSGAYVLADRETPGLWRRIGRAGAAEDLPERPNGVGG